MPCLTLQPTALVHEAFVRLIGQQRVEWQGVAHFFRRSRADDAAGACGSSDSSPKYCFVAFRLGMVVFRKTV
jgi:hypothetical protein